MKARNLSYMKEYNRKSILKLLFKSSMCRAELAHCTSLTPAAVSIITETLINQGYIRETTRQNRKQMLEVNPDYAFIFGVHLARDTCSVCMTDFGCNILELVQIPTSEVYAVNDAEDWIVSSVETMMEKRKVPKEKVLGIGINAPGPLNFQKGVIVNPPNFEQYHHYPIVKRLSERIDFPVYLEKNTLAVRKNLLGEFRCANVFFIMMLDGIGGTLILNNELVSGSCGMGGEIGHMSIDKSGPLCACGNRGCLELYASEKAIVQRAQEQGCVVNSWKDIVDKAEEGLPLYKNILMQEASFLATGIVNVLNLIDLNEVLISGFTGYHPKLLLQYVNEEVQRCMIAHDDHIVEVKDVPVAPYELVVSAAATVINQILTT